MSKVKKDLSPGFLAPEPVVKKTGKKVLALIAAVIGGLVLVLMLTMTSSKNDPARDEGLSVNKVFEGENKPLTPPLEGFGLVGPEKSGTSPQKRDRDQEKEEAENQVKVVGPPRADPEAEARRREAEEIRRRKFDRDQQAYGSVILVRREGNAGGAGGVSADKGGGNINGQPQSSQESAGPDAYDPAADRDKEAFFVRADNRQWISPHTREAGREYEIKTGSVIPGVMISGINSDLPGSLIAQVSQNVYDTATGRHLLLPQGSRLFGVYDSRVIYGQRRILIAWNRIIFPDGSSITLGAMPGTDLSGYAGFEDKVNNHYLRIFGSAVLMSGLTGGLSYAMDRADNDNSSDDSPSMRDEMASALAAQIGQTALRLLEKNLNVKPTLEIRPGYEFNIVAVRDLVFREAYGR